MSKQKVIIIGAGLAGSLLSTYLAKRGIASKVYEARSDMRKEEIPAGRSINLALSDRGIAALKEVGMDEYMLAEAVPMRGRMIHSIGGETKLLPYSGREGEYINSVSRGGLNVALINEADNYPESTFYFDQRCIDFDCSTGKALIENSVTGEKFEVKGDTLIATDGAGSAVRQSMMNGGIPRFNYEQKFLDHGYKELHIPPGDGGSFLIEKNALHIWARGEFLMIALPNFDGSFTCTLFLAFEGKDSFEAIENGRWGNSVSTASDSEHLDPKTGQEKIGTFNPQGSNNAENSLLKFFEHYFPDSIPYLPNLSDDFFSNPTGNLGTVKCLPWNAGGKALLLGDSAHAMVPFYGQGMNCAFEDCRVLDSLIEKHGRDWETVFENYTEQRKPNADAICDLAEENFFEMRDAVADPVFQRKRELETRLEQTFPDYFSKYSLVTFREDVPYSEAKKRGNAQDEILMKICSEIENVNDIDLNDVLKQVGS
ncbi:MAG: NAD(P)/FAD-dependent oxidoreductase [Pyrinomonadaceae bacterium]